MLQIQSNSKSHHQELAVPLWEQRACFLESLIRKQRAWPGLSEGIDGSGEQVAFYLRCLATQMKTKSMVSVVCDYMVYCSCRLRRIESHAPPRHLRTACAHVPVLCVGLTVLTEL